MKVTIRLLMVLFLLWFFGIANADRLSKVRYIEYTVLDIKEGGRGLISDGLLNPLEDILINIDGRIIGLKKDNIVTFLRDPDIYLAKVERQDTFKHKVMDKIHRLKYQITYTVPGEICVVSGMVMGPNDVTLMITGRRIPFKKEGVVLFMKNPEKYISKLQARGGFLSESGMGTVGVSYMWFYLGLYILWSLIFSALSANLALTKGLSIKRWFIIGLLTNIIGYIYLLLRGSKDNVIIPKGMGRPFLTTQPVRCAICGYENHPVVNHCLKCGKELVLK